MPSFQELHAVHGEQSRDNQRQNAMKNSLIFAVLCTLSGCNSSQRNGHPPPGAPVALSKDFRREHDQEFSPLERDIIRAAQRYLAQSGKRPKAAAEDAYYRVRHTPAGHEVFICYVTGYEGTRPLLEPCLHNAVLFRKDGSILGALTGPECWP
jgi:hypothetical protein